MKFVHNIHQVPIKSGDFVRVGDKTCIVRSVADKDLTVMYWVGGKDKNCHQHLRLASEKGKYKVKYLERIDPTRKPTDDNLREVVNNYTCSEEITLISHDEFKESNGVNFDYLINYHPNRTDTWGK